MSVDIVNVTRQPKINRDTAYWLKGQIDAIGKAALQVASTVACHDASAAQAMGDIQYACNRAFAAIENRMET